MSFIPNHYDEGIPVWAVIIMLIILVIMIAVTLCNFFLIRFDVYFMSHVLGI